MDNVGQLESVVRALTSSVYHCMARRERWRESPAAIYDLSLLMAAITYWILQTALINTHGHNTALKKAIGRDFKGKLSPALYIIAIIFAFVAPLVSHLIHVAVASMWIVPDRKIARKV